MSPPITFSQWMDKLCENKFLGSNSASPSSFKASPKVSPELTQGVTFAGETWDILLGDNFVDLFIIHTFFIEGYFFVFLGIFPFCPQKSPLVQHKKLERCDVGDTWDGLLRDSCGPVYEGQLLSRTVNGQTKLKTMMNANTTLHQFLLPLFNHFFTL